MFFLEFRPRIHNIFSGGSYKIAYLRGGNPYSPPPILPKFLFFPGYARNADSWYIRDI